MEAKAGTKGNWDKNINPPSKAPEFKPNTTYNVDGHLYKTDPMGRVNKVDADLSLNKADRNTYQQCAAGKCGNAGDDGGHLIASSLGGAGDRINLVPQASTLNRKDWKAMETLLANELKAGKAVNVKIDVGYPSGNTLRPNEFKVTAIIDGKPREWEFDQ